MKKALALVTLLMAQFNSRPLLAENPKIEVQGHRGARARRPENTWPAFQYALENGVDVLEMDIAITKDGVPVVTHEPIADPALCRGPKEILGRNIFDLTLAQVESLDCGSLLHPRFKDTQELVPGTPMPTLTEIFEKTRAHPNIRYNIETKITPETPDDPKKHGPTADPETFTRLILETVKKYKVLDRVTLQSFDFRTLKIARRLEPKLLLSALTDDFYEAPKIVKDLGLHEGEIISPDFTPMVSGERASQAKRLVQKLHEQKVRVIPWTANTPLAWGELVKLGVDGIISDDPKSLIEYLKQKGLR